MKFSVIDHQPTRGSVLVIGYGNPLRGDDSLGCIVADELIEGPRPPGLQIIMAHQLTPEIADPLSRVSLAIFVDAVASGAPGCIECRAITPESAGAKSICHHLSPERLLGYARSLYGHAPEAWAVTVAGELWGYCDHLSPPVSMAVPKVLHRIDLLVAARLASNLSAAGA